MPQISAISKLSSLIHFHATASKLVGLREMGIEKEETGEGLIILHSNVTHSLEAVASGVLPVQGGIIHRYGPRVMIVKIPGGTEETIKKKLKEGVLATTHDEIPDSIIVDLDAIGELGVKSFKLRRSARYAETKANRPLYGRPWGTEGVPIPDVYPVDDVVDDGASSVTVKSASTSDRLIGTVAVGLIMVEGPNEGLKFSEEERIKIVAEVQDGLSWLASQEPDVNLSWSFSTEVIALDVQPIDGVDPKYPKPIAGNWRGLPAEFNEGIDAAFWRESNDKIYFFKGNQYVRLTGITMDPDYPQPIEGNWRGLPAEFNEGIDAAFWRESNGKIYFFKGNQYVRLTGITMDPDYPRPIAGTWPLAHGWRRLPVEFNEGIDAALMRRSNGKIYFFKGDQYVRLTGRTMDPGYPKPIAVAGAWPGLPAEFNEGIDAALWRESNRKIYFFKGAEYVRLSFLTGKGEKEKLWRDPAMQQLGYRPGDAGVKDYVEDIRKSLGTQWAYAAYFTKYPLSNYAFDGRPRVVMDPASPNVGPNGENIDMAFVHETCHVFGAVDEYPDSKCNCGGQHGYFKIRNGNCERCAFRGGVPCVMRINDRAICDYTRLHLGWPIFFDTLAINFERVALTDIRTTTLTINNYREVDLRVSLSASSSPLSFFEWFALDEVIPPGENKRVRIDFAPRAEGHFEETLIVQTGVPESPHLISLSGTGIQGSQL